MRKRGEIIALLILVVFIVVMASLSQHEETDKTSALPKNVIRSSYRTFPEGYKALYLTLEELQYPVLRQIRPLTMLPPQGFLIVTDPYKKTAGEAEGQKLVAWVARGNYALICIEHHPKFLDGLEGDNATRAQQGQDVEDPLQEEAPSGSPTPQDTTVAHTTAHLVGENYLKTSAPTLDIYSQYRFPENQILPPKLEQLTGKPEPLYRDKQGIVAAYSKIGQGGIVWCCSPWSFSNEGIKAGKNLDFLLALANRRSDGSPVIFDEYHHGYGAEMTVWDLAPSLTKVGIIQLAISVILLFVLVAWRFGPYRLPAEERFTRSRAEYLTSMASLLHRAKATQLVRDRLRHLLCREMGRRLGLSSQVAWDVLRVANAKNPVVDQAGLERVWQQLTALENQTRPDHESVFRLSCEIHRLLRQKIQT